MELALVLDCTDPDRLAGFWCAVLRYRRVATGPVYVTLAPAGTAGGPELLLQRVPERKAGKNRMHLDLRVPDLAPEVARLRALGATLLHAPFDDAGWLTAVLADPEGNEFCALVPGPRAVTRAEDT